MMRVSGLKLLYRLISILVICSFCVNIVVPSYAEGVLWGQGIELFPKPGLGIERSQPMDLPLLKGMKVYAQNPFRFDFLLDRQSSSQKDLKQEADRVLQYFSAALTVSAGDLWVNLSPVEKDRIVPNGLGLTAMGRDLLAEDYLLKQLTASLIHPDGKVGRAFWDKVYAEAFTRFGTIDIPVDMFSRVWIVPKEADVFEREGKVFITKSVLKVMVESDYMASAGVGAAERREGGMGLDSAVIRMAEDVLRDVIIPVIEDEVNHGYHFAVLRQIYNALILAAWYKHKIVNSLMRKVYVDQGKINGIRIKESQIPQYIWKTYVDAFRQGVFNFIREEQDSFSGEVLPRKYFSGGMAIAPDQILQVATDMAVLDSAMAVGKNRMDVVEMRFKPFDAAMTANSIDPDETRKVIESFSQIEDVYRVGLDSDVLDRKIKGYRRVFNSRDTGRRVMDVYSRHIEAVKQEMIQLGLVVRLAEWPRVFDPKSKTYVFDRPQEHKKLQEEVDSLWRRMFSFRFGLYFEYDMLRSGSVNRELATVMKKTGELERLADGGDVEATRTGLRLTIVKAAREAMRLFLEEQLTGAFEQIVWREILLTPDGEWMPGASDVVGSAIRDMLEAQGAEDPDQLTANFMGLYRKRDSFAVRRLTDFFMHSEKMLSFMSAGLSVRLKTRRTGVWARAKAGMADIKKAAISGKALARLVLVLAGAVGVSLPFVSNLFIGESLPVLPIERKAELSEQQKMELARTALLKGVQGLSGMEFQKRMEGAFLNPEVSQDQVAINDQLRKLKMQKSVLERIVDVKRDEIGKVAQNLETAPDVRTGAPAAKESIPWRNAPSGEVQSVPGKDQEVSSGNDGGDFQVGDSKPEVSRQPSSGHWVARQEGGRANYLTIQSYHEFDPLTWTLKKSTPDWVKWDSQGSVPEAWIMVDVSGGIVPVAPGYAIATVQTENPVEDVGIYYDRNNGSWRVDIKGQPGRIRLGIYPHQMEMRPFTIVDASGRELNRAEAEGRILSRLPDVVRQMIGTSRNIMTYSSIMPGIAHEIRRPKDMLHGAVMETIMACANAEKGVRATAGIIYGWLFNRKTKERYGGLVCEYNGAMSEDDASKQLRASLNTLYTNGFQDDFELRDERLTMKSFIPKKKFGTSLVAICFTSHVLPVLSIR